MGAITTTTIANELATIFEDTVTYQINRSTVLFNLLPKAPGISRNINFDVVSTDSLATTGETAYSDGADISTYSDDALLNATAEFVIHQRALRISDKAKDDAMATGNPAELAKLVGFKLKTSAETLFKDLNKVLYSGNPAANPAQVNGLLDPTSGALLNAGSYFGISRSSTSAWQSVNQGASGVPRPLTFDILYAFMTAIYNASGETPTMLVSAPDQWDKYALLHQNIRQMMQVVNTPGGPVHLDGGAEVLSFNGVPWFKDVDCPAGKVIALNLNHVGIEFERMFPGPDSAIAKYRPYPESQLGPGPEVDVMIKPLANSGQYQTFTIYTRPQLVVRRPNSCGVLSDLA